jgi:O-antigen ligase
MLLASSRTISQWFDDPALLASTEQVDGNPLERNVFLALLILGLLVLARRYRRVASLLRSNWPLVLFFTFCAISVIWSDIPAVALKRWVKALGDLVMVSIVLTDEDAPTAIKRFLGRVAFLLVPISVLLIKYYPYLGVRYSPLDGKTYIVGVTTNKNSLGVICLVVGIAAVWRILCALRAQSRFSIDRIMIAYGAVLALTLWLFLKAQSMTSLACFSLVSALMVAVSFSRLARKPVTLHLMVTTLLCCVAFALLLDSSGSLVQSLGKDATLTGRAEIWSEVLEMNSNPLGGMGFESFWTGSRLETLWSRHWWRPNEAHNGYIEVFLNLGLIGVMLLAIAMAAGYRDAIRVLLQCDLELGMLRVAYVVVALVYSFTEAGFRMTNPVWICCLLGAIVHSNPVAAKAVIAKPVLAGTSRRSWTQRGTPVTDGYAPAAIKPRTPAASRGSRFGRVVEPSARHHKSFR